MDTVSNELQIGKAGEHLVCFDLIRQGYNAFLSDQGLPYDVIVDVGGFPKRIQVKTTQKTISYEKAIGVYRFGLCRGRGNRGRFALANGSVDGFAFVALDIMKIAYLTVDEVTSTNASIRHIKQTMDFKTRSIQYPAPKSKNSWGTGYRDRRGFIEDFSNFDRILK